MCALKYAWVMRGRRAESTLLDVTCSMAQWQSYLLAHTITSSPIPCPFPHTYSAPLSIPLLTAPPTPLLPHPPPTTPSHASLLCPRECKRRTVVWQCLGRLG